MSSSVVDVEFASVSVQGVEYEIPESFTGRELASIEDAAALGKIRTAVRLAAVAMRRAGREVDEEFLLDLPFEAEGGIVFREVENHPPAGGAAGADSPAPPPGEPGQPGTPPSSSEPA